MNKKVESPIELYYRNQRARSFLTDNNILSVKQNGKITIPSCMCTIETPGVNGKIETKVELYPFWHQKFMFMLEYFGGDANMAMELFNPGMKSFLCGKGMSTTVYISENNGYVG